MKVFDYSCKLCQTFYLDRFVTEDNDQYCDHCHGLLVKLLSATAGYVKGTRTPCRNEYKKS